MTTMLVPFDWDFSPAERVFDRLFGWDEPIATVCDEGWTPSADFAETDKAYMITIELPGVDKSKVDITYEDGHVSVKGEKEKEAAEGESCNCSERFFGSFSRTFHLGGSVDRDKIDANYKDGVLKLVLPKSEESIPKKIEIH
jgi:HSP20 family protein